MIEYLSQPWPWYVAGPMIAVVMFLLLYFGKSFGVSNNLRTMCTVAGAGKFSEFFKINKSSQYWNLVFVLGAVIGGMFSSFYLANDQAIILSEATVTNLETLGFENVGNRFMPAEIFGLEQLMTIKGVAILLIGGVLVGFGSRYAGGCTSGHAISGISNLQLPSLIAVIGFFVGGLVMVHLIIPFIF